jgi:hypothetical protein
MKFIKIALITLVFFLSITVQSQSFDYEKAWEKADSLENKYLPDQALHAVDIILQQARKDGESLQKIKSIIYKSNYRKEYAEEEILKTIEEIEGELKQAKGVEKSMLLIALSDSYLQYYHQNQWAIRQRKDIAGDMPKRITEWSQSNFNRKIESLLLTALSFETELKEIAAESWNEVFISNDNSFAYQPFLFDFIAWKAIDFYSSYEFANQANEDLVLLNDSVLYKDYSYFVKLEFGSFKDLSNKEKTLVILQKLAKLHQTRKTATSLLYEESKRLDYLSNNGIIDEKEMLILQTQEKLFKNYQGLAGSEIIAKKLIRTYLSFNFKSESNIKKADNICQIMINAGIDKDYFTGISKNIYQQELSISLEGVILPHQFSLAKIDFKNLDHAWFKIVKIDKDTEIKRNRNEEIDFQKFLTLPHVANFGTSLAKHTSLLNKTALFQIPQLDYGRYAVIASSSPNFNSKIDQMTIGFFWVSKLQLLNKEYDNAFLIIDRESGKPIEGAEIKAYSNKWEYSSRKNIKTLIANYKSDKNGNFIIEVDDSGKRRSNTIFLEIAKGTDEWVSHQIYIANPPSQAKLKEKHYFFTDRAIYRPGQRVYFKGIITQQLANDIKPLPNKTTEVKFYSTQGKVIQTLSLNSNEFGSVSGSFVCPLSGLNGNMRITDGKGSVSFKMEEYKRPKFEVAIDMPTKEYNLNEEITINGTASYYAGIGVQNAHVKYRVVRSAYMPYRWTYWPIQTKTPIAAGEAKTNEKGEFSIIFNAIAPQKTNEVYWYNYSIITEVTDQTGETHTQTLDMRLGNHSLFIEAQIPSIIDNTKAKDVLVKAQTPNGKKVESILKFKLEILKSPKHIILQRNWESDTILLSKENLEQNFKEFSTSGDLSDFEVKATVLEKTLNTKVDSIIPKSIFQSLPSGAYKMTLTTTDKNGKEVKEIAFTSIFSSENNKLAYAKDEFFLLEKAKVLVGDSICFSFGSSYKKQAYYYQLSHGMEIIESGWRKLHKELEHTIIPVKEKYRGEVSAQIFFMENNRFHSFTARINVPYDNKELDVRLVSMRNPMQPGQKEKWTLQIKNNKGDALAAEILAGMYDASLDVFAKNNWDLNLYSYSRSYYHWNNIKGRFSSYKNYIKHNNYNNYRQEFSPLEFIWENNTGNRNILYMSDQSKRAMPTPGAMMDDMDVSDNIATTVGGISAKSNVEVEDNGSLNIEIEAIKSPLSPRTNLQETAFFYPQLTTDKDGYVQLHFTSPEALSKWKLMVLATTKDMEIGSLTQEFTTQKELMVMPNLPRFLRGGDHITISTKIINLLNEEQNVKAELEILDAKSMQAIHILDENDLAEKSISIKSKGQVTVHWKLIVPEEVGAVVIRVLAKGDKHQDGEEHILPVLSQLQFLTDTHPFTLSGNQSLTPKDLKVKDNGYKENDELTLEITTHPLWYVVQALPNYTPPQNPAALNWFQYYFINSMASSIIKNNPQIETVFKQWQINNSDELKSELEQNQELKQILIEETPWVLNAENQSKRKQQIAQLFDKNTLEYNLSNSIDKLKELQKPNGGWSWYHGMRESVYITAEIIKGIGQLKKDDIISFKKYHPAKAMTNKAIKYLDEELMELHKKVLSDPKRFGAYQANKMIEARAFFYDDVKLGAKTQEAYHYFLDIWKREWQKSSIMEQVRLAKVLIFSHQTNKAQEILLSLKDKSLKDEFGGIYWRDLMKYSAAKNQASMIELFEMTKTDKAFVNGLKTWLLEQKRANDWGDGKATAQACYALLKGSNALDNKSQVFLTINGHTEKVEGNAGTGYYKATWRGGKIQENLKGLKIKTEGEGLVFGAFYHQYFEKVSEIKAHEGGVEIEKKVFVAKTKNGKNELFRLSESSPIELGDRVLVRLSLNNKQAMDFVHLRDYLPAGFENQKPLSGFQWQGNIGFYQSPSDIATDYFIYHLPKGEFVIEYELNATSSGILNMGPAEIQSLYAPEFGGRSSGGIIIIE